MTDTAQSIGETVLMQACHVGKEFGRGKRRVTALHDVDIEVRGGECLALIGGSGSGKSTLSRILLGLDAPTTGSVRYRGLPVEGRRSAGHCALRRESGIVFQDPFGSLDPRWTLGRSIAEPLRIHHGDWSRTRVVQAVRAALNTVGLDPTQFVNRYPIDCSGGQAQRVAIARAMVDNPKVIVADEPMSAIDVAARLQILDAFAAIRKADPDAALLMVSHDLGVVQHIADRIVVLHEGRVEEEGPTGRVLSAPESDYTRELVRAASSNLTYNRFA